MSKINKISGFPEWLPRQKVLEDKLISTIRGIYQSYGFTPIETPSAELISTLQSKGVIDKEIYILKRAKQEEGEESDLALHFDLTVPFARYVGQHFNELTFPFKRYQLQKVWRGERPQKGRFREFYQFDIDTIAQDELPLSCDAEVLSAIGDVFTKINVGKFRIRVNSRKLLHGIYESLGLDEVSRKTAITIVDKIDKIGKDGVLRELLAKNIGQPAAERIVELSVLKFTPASFIAEIGKLQIEGGVFAEGQKEVSRLLELVSSNAKNNISIDLSLARGLDYYTGLIFEVVFEQYPEFGSVCSGGRYDDLASQFINKKLPGVGVSIGLTRLMDLIFTNDLLPLDQENHVKVMVAVYDEPQRAQCNQLAEKFRELNIACEVYFKSPKLGKQIDYAASRNIPYVAFVNADKPGLEIKDLKSKTQQIYPDVSAFVSSLG